MFDWVQNNKRVAQVLLFIIAIPFALFGIERYQSGGGALEAAKVGDTPISTGEFDRAFQSQLDSIRRILGRNFQSESWNTPEQRRQVLDALINQKLVLDYAQSVHLEPSVDGLRAAIAAMPGFQVDGKFSPEQYRTLLRSQGYTEAAFEAGMRQDLMTQRLAGGIADTAIVSKALVAQALSAAAEQRRVATAKFVTGQYTAQVKIDPAAVDAYYKAGTQQFEIPEQIRAEYVLLNQQALIARESVGEDEVRKIYEQKYAGPLKAREAAREKANQILAELKRSPGSFADLAKRESQDPGSASKGGDLGYFSRGAMVKPFEDAAFALSVGQMSDLVESEFGFHIIKLTDIRAGAGGQERRASHILISAPEGAKRFDEVRQSIDTDLKRQKVQSKFAQAVEDLQSLADQQNDSLEPFVRKFGLPVQSSPWMSKEGAPGAGVAASPKVLQALFTADSIKTRHASDAIEASPGNLVVARVAEYKPARTRPLDEVRPQIERMLTEREALKRARDAGIAALAALQKTPGGAAQGLAWSATEALSRDKPGAVSAQALAAIFRADAGKLPAYVGVEEPTGYALYRIDAVLAGAPPTEQQLAAADQGLRRQEGQDDLRAFVTGLRSRVKVTVNPAVLEVKP